MIIKPYNRADPNPKLINHSEEEKERNGGRTQIYHHYRCFLLDTDN